MQSYEEFKRELLACRRCEALFGYEPRPVLWGNPDAKVLQIGQAPSKRVHLSQRPFSDASGARLREWYGIDEATFYNPDNFYITALGRCFPGKAPAGGDRPPPGICAQLWLEREMALMENALTVLVGSYAAAHFFAGQRFEALVFGEVSLRGKPALVLPHPSPLNNRWLKQHPEFETRRLPEIRRMLRRVLAP